MTLFSKKYPVLFISKHFIDPGLVTAGKALSFDGFEALEYTEDTLADILRQIVSLFKKNIRVVLSEELVYVTRLSFPPGTHLTRDLVRRTLEETIPEDLSSTEWDFQTLHYAKKQETEMEILVQAAVVEGNFFRLFTRTLEMVPLSIENIIPESYALAQLASGFEGTTLLVTRGRESTLLAAVESGSVIASHVESGEVTLIQIETFLAFVVTRKTRKIVRIIFSRLSEEEMAPFQKLATDGYELIQEGYNPLVGAVLQKPIKGKDEAILSLNIFFLDQKKPWWKVW